MALDEEMGMLLQKLQGQINDDDYDVKADLAQRILLQRHLLKRLTGSPTGLASPYPGEPPSH